MKFSLRALIGSGVLVALVLASVVSYYASSSPDGLNRVAEDKGFAHTAKDSGVAGSPLAGYEAGGVDNPRASRAIAGVAGCVAVLILSGGLAFVSRRRTGLALESEEAEGEGLDGTAVDPTGGPAHGGRTHG